MSITTELQRLSQAKANLKTTIEKRGAIVRDEQTIDAYASILNNCPYAVEGSFIPEADTKTFMVNGLPFSPSYLSVVCPSECNSSSTNYSVIGVVMSRGYSGVLMYRVSVGNKFAFIGSTASVIKFSDNGVTITLPSNNADTYFLKGNVYRYCIIGGYD